MGILLRREQSGLTETYLNTKSNDWVDIVNKFNISLDVQRIINGSLKYLGN
jgi:hypothetical protein